MSEPVTEPVNEPLSEPQTWQQEDTERWLSLADQREHGLAPLVEVLLAAADLRAGEHVLDVGCGTGPTTAAAARGVRPGGSVTGLDLAAELVEEAGRRVREPEARWVVGDATTVELPERSVDVVISRFGTMFFADPGRAFAHLATLTRPGGRLAMVVWPPRDEVEQFAVPYEAARAALEAAGAAYVEPDPHRGAFSLGREEHVRALLQRSGWSGVDVATREVTLPYGLPGADLATTARTSLETGPAGVLLEEATEQVRADAAALLVEQLRSRTTPGGTTIDASVRVVTARRA